MVLVRVVALVVELVLEMELLEQEQLLKGLMEKLVAQVESEVAVAVHHKQVERMD